MYDVFWLQDAVDQLLDIARQDFKATRRIATEVRTYGRVGRADIKKLNDAGGEWRLRAGDWRLRVTIEGSRVHVISVDNRRDAY